MSVPRPLPKSVLKKMFLKVLHEHKRPGGCYTDRGWYADGIVRKTIAEFFKIDPLTEDECTEGLRAAVVFSPILVCKPLQKQKDFTFLCVVQLCGSKTQAATAL